MSLVKNLYGVDSDDDDIGVDGGLSGARKERLERAKRYLEGTRKCNPGMNKGAIDDMELTEAEQELSLSAKAVGGMSSLHKDELSALLEMRLYLAVVELRKPIGDLKTCNRYLEQVLSYDNKNAHAHWLRGLMFLKLQNFDSALGSLRLGLEIAEFQKLPERDVWVGQLMGYEEQIAKGMKDKKFGCPRPPTASTPSIDKETSPLPTGDSGKLTPSGPIIEEVVDDESNVLEIDEDVLKHTDGNKTFEIGGAINKGVFKSLKKGFCSSDGDTKKIGDKTTKTGPETSKLRADTQTTKLSPNVSVTKGDATSFRNYTSPTKSGPSTISKKQDFDLNTYLEGTDIKDRVIDWLSKRTSESGKKPDNGKNAFKTNVSFDKLKESSLQLQTSTNGNKSEIRSKLDKLFAEKMQAAKEGDNVKTTKRNLSEKEKKELAEQTKTYQLGDTVDWREEIKGPVSRFLHENDNSIQEYVKNLDQYGLLNNRENVEELNEEYKDDDENLDEHARATRQAIRAENIQQGKLGKGLVPPVKLGGSFLGRKKSVTFQDGDAKQSGDATNAFEEYALELENGDRKRRTDNLMSRFEKDKQILQKLEILGSSGQNSTNHQLVKANIEQQLEMYEKISEQELVKNGADQDVVMDKRDITQLKDFACDMNERWELISEMEAFLNVVQSRLADKEREYEKQETEIRRKLLMDQHDFASKHAGLMSTGKRVVDECTTFMKEYGVKDFLKEGCKTNTSSDQDESKTCNAPSSQESLQVLSDLNDKLQSVYGYQSDQTQRWDAGFQNLQIQLQNALFDHEQTVESSTGRIRSHHLEELEKNVEAIGQSLTQFCGIMSVERDKVEEYMRKRRGDSQTKPVTDPNQIDLTCEVDFAKPGVSITGSIGTDGLPADLNVELKTLMQSLQKQPAQKPSVSCKIKEKGQLFAIFLVGFLMVMVVTKEFHVLSNCETTCHAEIPMLSMLIK